MIVSRLSFASVYSTICTKYIVIAYKICYKGSLDFGIPGVSARGAGGKYDSVGFPPAMGSSPNTSFHVFGLWPALATKKKCI